jgi:hypothetical protein
MGAGKTGLTLEGFRGRKQAPFAEKMQSIPASYPSTIITDFRKATQEDYQMTIPIYPELPPLKEITDVVFVAESSMPTKRPSFEAPNEHNGRLGSPAIKPMSPEERAHREEFEKMTMTLPMNWGPAPEPEPPLIVRGTPAFLRQDVENFRNKDDRESLVWKLDRRVAELASGLADAEARFANAVNTLNERNLEVAELKSQREDLEAELLQRDQTISSLEMGTKPPPYATEALRESRHTISEMTNAAGKLKAELSDANKHNQDLRDRLRDLDKPYAAALEREQEGHDKTLALQAELDATIEALDLSSEKVVAQQERIIALQELAADLDEQVIVLSEANSDFVDEQERDPIFAAMDPAPNFNAFGANEDVYRAGRENGMAIGFHYAASALAAGYKLVPINQDA